MNVPQLRFDGFSGKWEEVSLGKLGDFTKGMALSKADISEEGDPCILYGELYTKYGPVINQVKSRTNSNQSKRVLGTKNDVLIPSSGETAIDIACASALETEDVLLGGDLNIFRPKENVSGAFLSYQINGVRKFELSKLAQGASVVHLYSNSLKNFKVKLPTFDEQQKIALFFKSLDKKIEKQQVKIKQLEQLKKGMMQKIFSQELRFKDDDGGEFGEWEKKTLNNFVKLGKAGGTPRSSNRRYYNGDIPFLSIKDMTDQGKFIIKTEKYINEEGLKNSSAWLVPSNALIYSMYASVGFVCINKLPISTSQAMYSMVLKDSSTLEYLYYYLSYFRLNGIQKFIETGTQGNLNANTVKNIIVPSPTLKEQKKIGKFLPQIDVKIEKEKEKLMVLEEQKKGFIQGMFV